MPAEPAPPFTHTAELARHYLTGMSRPNEHSKFEAGIQCLYADLDC